MTDTVTPPEQLQQQLAALLAQLQPPAGSVQPVASGWQRPQMTAAPTGLAVPLSIETPNGKIRVYLQYSAEVAASPQAIMSLLESLASQGYPLDIWRGQSGWGGSSRSGGSGWRR